MGKSSCPCTDQRKIFCSVHSRYKMVILLRAGYHRKKDASGKPINPVRYSFFKEEKKGPKGVFDIMLKRVMKSEWATKFHKVEFYENNGEFLDEFKR